MFSWRQFLKDAGISSEFCVIYEDIFEQNRIDKEMLPDLTKEYLNAMNIEAVGDVIKILKYSKLVCERNRISKAKISDVSESSVCKSSVSSSTAVVQKQQPRRVLPEHEGRYKISMPSGSTPKSRAIIAKMQSDKQEKKSIFDRLTSSDVEITSTSPDIVLKTKSSSIGQKKSIFNRLGNYKELDKEANSKKLWPTAARGIVKSNQRLKTSLPKKNIQKELNKLKINEDIIMESEKQVTFSPEVTLRVYEPQNKTPKTSQGSVKSRLGGNSLGLVKTSMKASPPHRLNKMKSDMMRKESVYSRLSNQKSVFKRLGE